MKNLTNRNMRFFINNQNIFWLYPPIKKNQKSKKANQLILMNVENNLLIDNFLLREYDLFSQTTESSLEQLKMEFCIYEKVNNSIATELTVTLINNHRIFL